VQPGKRFGIVLTPWNGVGAPALVVARIVAVHRGCSSNEPFPGDRHVRPLDDFRLCFGAQLVFGVGSHHHLAVLAGIHTPLDKHGDKRGFSDAVAGCPGNHQRLVPRLRILEVIAYFPECISLPLARP